MKIKVEQKHINAGQRFKCHLCPVALAIQHTTDTSQDEVSVGMTTIQWSDKSKGNYETPTPASARRFISQFDQGKPVKPFSFELKI